jgi:asparagine synthetase B (glutamine-hydrolysing)
MEQCLSESLKLRVIGIPVPPNLESKVEVKLGILFSGGLDCTLLARMVHELLPLHEQIDLLNVAFENPRVVEASKRTRMAKQQPASASLHYQKSGLEEIMPDLTLGLVESQVGVDATLQHSAYEACPDRITGRSAVAELRRVCPGRVWRFVEVRK